MPLSDNEKYFYFGKTEKVTLTPLNDVRDGQYNRKTLGFAVYKHFLDVPLDNGRRVDKCIGAANGCHYCGGGNKPKTGWLNYTWVFDIDGVGVEKMVSIEFQPSLMNQVVASIGASLADGKHPYDYKYVINKTGRSYPDNWSVEVKALSPAEKTNVAAVMANIEAEKQGNKDYNKSTGKAYTGGNPKVAPTPVTGNPFGGGGSDATPSTKEEGDLKAVDELVSEAGGDATSNEWVQVLQERYGWTERRAVQVVKEKVAARLI